MPFYSRPSAAPSSGGRAWPAPLLVTALVIALLPSPAAIAQCNGYLANHTPASGVPSQLWGDLQPTDKGQLPGVRDTTGFTEFTSWLTNPYFQSVDVESGWLFVATSQRFQIWDANINPGLPEIKADVGINSMNLTWGADAHAFIPFQHADSPPGRADLAALVGENGTGMIIFNTSNKNSPAIVYQDHGPDARTRKAKQVHTTLIGGRAYGFAAAEGEGGGVLIYDMDAAKSLSSRCTEGQPGSTVCPGVYLGKLGTRNTASFVHGVGNYVIVSSASTIFGMEIWDVSTPTAPRRVMNALSSEVIYGVAMWQEGSKYYAAVRSQFAHRIYDVSCITQGGSCGPTQLWSRTAGFPALPGLGTVSFSRSNNTPFLYWGTASNCSKFPQEEWLDDVSNPSVPRDITPQAQVTIDGEAVTYWSWYYRNGGASGFNHILPKSGKFYGSYFYRAAKGLLDVHQRTGALPPIADFTYTPELIYPGTSVTFADASTGQPVGWNWTFSPDGNPSFSTQENPTVSFSGTGSKTVTLQATNGAGSDDTVKTLTVLDPDPKVTSVSASPSPALLCQPITFQAEGVTGEPPLTFDWQVLDANNQLVDSVSGGSDSFVLQALPNTVTAGESYTAEVTISNASGTVTRMSAPVLINALPALPADQSFSPTYTGFPANPSNGNVDFQVNVPGATEWRWNYDVVGGSFGPWTDDPINGPAPTHSYTVAGTYQVQVEVRNCVEVERSSTILNVTIDNISPLKAQFAAAGIFCISEGCFADTGQSITFADQSTGEPDSYDYDWDGNGSYENPGNTSPVTSHTYTSSGEYEPKLRIKRGSQTDVYTHPKIIVSTAGGGGGGGGGGGTPSITITGVSGGTTNQALTFTATATNCTPSTTGWSWNTSGGTVTGASNSNRITVSWSSTGSKVLRAANTSCNPATGTRSVTISAGGGGGGGGGGTLKAVIKITPTTPQAGDTVTFSGTSSSGSPTNYTWRIDGDLVSGATVTQTFSKAGSYPIELEVSRQDPSCAFGVCSDKATTTLAVGGGIDQLLASFGVNVACFGNVCSVEAGQTIQFTDTSTGPVSSRQWNFGDGTTSTAANPSHSWSSAGVYAVVLNVTDGEGGSAQAARTFEVTGPVLNAGFTTDRPCVGGVCTVARNQTVQFTDQSVGEISSRQWAFGDGSTSTDLNPTYKWSAAGLYTVILTVTDGEAQDSAQMLFQVQGPPPVVARFDSDAACTEEGCAAETLDAVQFTDNSDGELTTWEWDFGDGTTSVLQNPTHAWRAPGQYTVKLTVSDGEQQDSTTQTYDITGLPVGHNSVLLPWVVQGQGALNQSSKLYLHNPDSEPRTFKIRFLRRPAAGSDIPEIEIELSPGATAFFNDVMAEVFGLDNVSGFIEIEPDDITSMTPVAVGFHQTFQDDGTAFGQGVPGVPKLSLPKAGPGERMHLIGLNDNDDRFGFFGITNPNDAGVSFRLHFYNRRGERIGDTPDDFVVARLGQRQFQLNQLRNAFGIRDEVDYRVEVELLTAGLEVYTYGTNLRAGTEDPSFVRAGEPTAPKIYLLGALATSGLNNTEWQTDALLANVDSEMSTTVVTYVSAGNNAVPLTPETLTLLPGESKRLQNVLVDRWDVSNENGLGVLVFESTSETGVFPIVQGETYDNANPARRFGQFVAPLTDADIAEAGHRQILAGLQQDEGARSTIWVYNPGDTLAEYDLIYRGLDGRELGAIEGYRVRPERMRQINPSSHPIPAEGAEGGFTVQIVVRSGQLLSAAQVVNDANNDPSYVTGVPR